MSKFIKNLWLSKVKNFKIIFYLFSTRIIIVLVENIFLYDYLIIPRRGYYPMVGPYDINIEWNAA